MPQVFYYADRIFQSAGVETNNVQYVTVSIGAINVVMTCLAVSVCWGSLGSHLSSFTMCDPGCHLHPETLCAVRVLHGPLLNTTLIKCAGIKCCAPGIWSLNPFCLFQVFIVESLGRRILLLAGFGLCCGSCAVLTLALNLQVCGWGARWAWPGTCWGTNPWCVLNWVLYSGKISVLVDLPKVNPTRATVLLGWIPLPAHCVHTFASICWKQRSYVDHVLSGYVCLWGHSWEQRRTLL